MLKTLGRLFLGSLFIYGGAGIIMQPEYREKLVEKAGLPYPHQATILNGAVMVVAGSTLAAGLLPKLSALALVGPLAATTVVGHAFWKEQEAASRANQQTQFFKNLACIGGLLLVITGDSE
ncbi:DoxX family protein [Dictyobacter arantiisoli]|uniref:DoxX family protein n=1 Tax=Dictyobacter arantiisoli TaxID=2014874 RepID=A0A5A5TD93_9CHLR|nr:DoxX family protein [Dictyobacter arantiisoli]GCF09501.1 hypothetical protein KDI_30650 [Dictyobacter arantiisoli]